MSRRDPGAANGAVTGAVADEPGRCLCGHLISFHKPAANGQGACSSWMCLCRRYQPVEEA